MENNLLTPITLSFGIDRDSELTLGQGSCIRTVHSRVRRFFESFVESDCGLHLADSGQFISSEIVSSAGDQNLILRHPEIPFVLYPYEWTPHMLRDAALMFLDLVETLEKAGYTLKDGHPWNIVYDGPNPVWVDFTSVAEKSVLGSFPARMDFLNYFVRPLRMFAADLAPYARLGLTQLMGPPGSWLENPLAIEAAHAYLNGSRSGLKFAVKDSRRALNRKILHGSSRPHTSMYDSIDELRKLVSDLVVTPRSGEWTNYYKGMNTLPKFDPASSDFTTLIRSTPKHEVIFSVLQKYRPKTILDIGCNTGLYSFMAESLGARSVGLDADEYAVDEMYRAAKVRGVKVTTGYADFVTPLRASEYLHKPSLRSLHSRVRSDVVLCLAVIHHWIFKRLQLRFSDVVNILSETTVKVLVVEFVPPDDEHVSRWMTPNYDWYSLDNFVKALNLSFAQVEILESYPSPRKLLVCSK